MGLCHTLLPMLQYSDDQLADSRVLIVLGVNDPFFDVSPAARTIRSQRTGNTV